MRASISFDPTGSTYVPDGTLPRIHAPVRSTGTKENSSVPCTSPSYRRKFSASFASNDTEIAER